MNHAQPPVIANETAYNLTGSPFNFTWLKHTSLCPLSSLPLSRPRSLFGRKLRSVFAHGRKGVSRRRPSIRISPVITYVLMVRTRVPAPPIGIKEPVLGRIPTRAWWSKCLWRTWTWLFRTNSHSQKQYPIHLVTARLPKRTLTGADIYCDRKLRPA